MILVPSQTGRTFGLVTLMLPGTDRKRSLSLYQYRVTYRNPDPVEPGCAMTWEVSGGRLPYQIAAERLDGGAIKWHCSCADAVYRGEDNPDHVCKHVHGLLEMMPTLAKPQRSACQHAA
ncbi:hypothetical protein [Limnoglobus roseus]|uniref:SWIM-type domain-containing protein n=1 Tax=Limnoglobus roseus TaxID=2598579 RepID=A0A5C1AUR4_9BACT|nr:hypothetical protein [Limnoglobus roseus]QEL21004.1 hypothetical protein PX52LOC_08133 [Limnoglobus roseus]